MMIITDFPESYKPGKCEVYIFPIHTLGYLMENIMSQYRLQAVVSVPAAKMSPIKAGKFSSLNAVTGVSPRPCLDSCSSTSFKKKSIMSLHLSGLKREFVCVLLARKESALQTPGVRAHPLERAERHVLHEREIVRRSGDISALEDALQRQDELLEFLVVVVEALAERQSADDVGHGHGQEDLGIEALAAGLGDGLGHDHGLVLHEVFEAVARSSHTHVAKKLEEEASLLLPMVLVVTACDSYQ